MDSPERALPSALVAMRLLSPSPELPSPVASEGAQGSVDRLSRVVLQEKHLNGAWWCLCWQLRGDSR